MNSKQIKRRTIERLRFVRTYGLRTWSTSEAAKVIAQEHMRYMEEQQRDLYYFSDTFTNAVMSRYMETKKLPDP